MLLSHNLRRSPWIDFEILSRQLEEFFGASMSPGLSRKEYPQVNIWANENHSVLTAELPGIDPKQLEITCKDNTITLKGERRAKAESGEEVYLRRERGQGSFQRSFTLPFKVDEEKISAEYKHGILSVKLPRREKPAPRKIEIKVK